MISVPWNVFAATKSTEENYFNLILNKYLAFSLRQQVKRLHYSSESGMFDVDIDSLLKVRFDYFYQTIKLFKKSMNICIIICKNISPRLFRVKL